MLAEREAPVDRYDKTWSTVDDDQKPDRRRAARDQQGDRRAVDDLRDDRRATGDLQDGRRAVGTPDIRRAVGDLQENRITRKCLTLKMKVKLERNAYRDLQDERWALSGLHDYRRDADDAQYIRRAMGDPQDDRRAVGDSRSKQQKLRTDDALRQNYQFRWIVTRRPLHYFRSSG